ncbi:MAG: [Oscillospiraceae bacterium]|nr:[FeFe] hydrogenase, group A [Oscillospiraceae bacterium]
MAKGIMIVDGQRVAFDGEKNVLSVIRKAGIEMPTFCYYSDLSVYGACRMCIVEDEKTGKIDASCSMEPRDGMCIRTNSAKLLKHRRVILELLLAAHDCNCTTCEKSGACHLQSLAQQFGVRRVRFEDTRENFEKDDTSPAVLRDPNKCILCGDCVRTCEEMQGVGILNFAFRGSEARVMPAFNRKLKDTNCVSCGQCAAVCPTGAITVRNQIGEAWAAIHDPKKRVVVQIAPAVRVAVGEAFGIPAGENALDKLVTALKLMGVDEVYDTNFGADMTTISESEEFLARLEKGGPFPMFTSCCPAWIKYLENENPKYLKNVSTCKSPMEMFAAVIRDKYAAKDAADGRDTFNIAIMPCTAKKMEAAREEFKRNGRPDVDLVLTTHEVIEMMQENGIQLSELELESPDMPFGMGTGAANIYGVTGGVAEAVVRHCLPDKSKNALREISLMGLRGDAPFREATVQVGDAELKIAICNGLVNAKKLLKDIDEGKAFYHLIEVMTCAGGCVGGAGQPHGLKTKKDERGAGLYKVDTMSMMKRAERNPVVTKMLADYGEHRCHELLHVSYVKK